MISSYKKPGHFNNLTEKLISVYFIVKNELFILFLFLRRLPAKNNDFAVANSEPNNVPFACSLLPVFGNCDLSCCLLTEPASVTASESVSESSSKYPLSILKSS